jgi:hypothetical protein
MFAKYAEHHRKATMLKQWCGERTQKETNDWKARMLKAGVPELSMPDDWEDLSEDEKESRLNKGIGVLRMKPKFFPIPHMAVCRADCSRYTNKRLTDEQMERIASKLSRYLMNEWAECLEIAVTEEVEQ